MNDPHPNTDPKINKPIIYILFRENVHVKERRNDAIASDQIEMKIGYLVDTRRAGSVVYMQIGLNLQVFIMQVLLAHSFNTGCKRCRKNFRLQIVTIMYFVIACFNFCFYFFTGCVDQELDKNEGETTKRRYFYITLLRSPISRYLSEFRYVYCCHKIKLMWSWPEKSLQKFLTVFLNLNFMLKSWNLAGIKFNFFPNVNF